MSFNTCTFVLLTTPLRSIFCACLFLYCTKRSDFHQNVVICRELTSLHYKGEHHSIIRVNITPFIRSELKEWQSLPHLECTLWQHFHSSFGVTFTPSFCSEGVQSNPLKELASITLAATHGRDQRKGQCCDVQGSRTAQGAGRGGPWGQDWMHTLLMLYPIQLCSRPSSTNRSVAMNLDTRPLFSFPTRPAWEWGYTLHYSCDVDQWPHTAKNQIVVSKQLGYCAHMHCKKEWLFWLNLVTSVSYIFWIIE